MMLNNLNDVVLKRMQALEKIDALDRTDGTPLNKRLCQISRETGQVLSKIAFEALDGDYIEIGTSAGYSTMWIYNGIIDKDVYVKTFEISDYKYEIAFETLCKTQLFNKIKIIKDDFLNHYSECRRIAFCFLDANKCVYEDCYDKVMLNMIKGGVLVADNIISHKKELCDFFKKVKNDSRVACRVVNVGKGLLICKKIK